MGIEPIRPEVFEDMNAYLRTWLVLGVGLTHPINVINEG
jgi:hypothetical protein